jgi:glycosyltransferase involved in cell wall biosynthesis
VNLSIIVPCYNEEENIGKVLEKLFLLKLPEYVTSMEIIVIDDCSQDNSCQIVETYAKNHSNLKLYRHDRNRGKGAAVHYGFKVAKGDVFLIQDADLELNPDDIPSMIHAMHTLNVEFVNGSRYMPGILRPLSSYRRYLANKFFTYLTAVLINVRLTDMACGYKMVHRNLISKLKLRENRFGFEAELIIKALRIKRNNIVEVPIQYFPRNAGEGKKLNNTDALRILGTIIKYGLFRVN